MSAQIIYFRPREELDRPEAVKEAVRLRLAGYPECVVKSAQIRAENLVRCGQSGHRALEEAIRYAAEMRDANQMAGSVLSGGWRDEPPPGAA